LQLSDTVFPRVPVAIAAALEEGGAERYNVHGIEIGN
jgi:hypothetical protein